MDLINIAFIIDRIWDSNGGTEKQLLLLMEHLDRKHFSPHLICLRNSTWLNSAKLSFPVYIVNMISLKPIHFLKALRKFRIYCKENDINIVQTFFRDGNLFGTIAAFLCRIKVIISSRRNLGHGYWHNKWWISILRVLQKITTHYICNSTMVADYTMSQEKVSKTKISIIYNGLILDEFKNITPELRLAQRRKMGLISDNILIGVLANMRPIKNLTLFVKTANTVYQKYPNARFIIIGEGPERTQLEKMIKEFDLERVFRLEGLQEIVIPYLSALDIGVLCSKSESLSNSIIEYMVAGLPVVVSDVGGNRETIGENRGIIFKNNDSEDLFEKLDILINDNKLRAKLGQDAHAYALEKYDLYKSILQHEILYKKWFKNNKITMPDNIQEKVDEKNC